MKRVILCPNPYRDNELTVAKRSRQLLEQIGFETVVCLPFSREGYGDQLGVPIRQLQQEIKRADLLIAFGGDGTILHLARTVALHNVPVLGINLGSLGFMSELEPNELERLNDLKNWDFTVESRMMLDVTVLREGRPVYNNIALNDAVVSKGSVARVVRLDVTTEEGRLTKITGDGGLGGLLKVASPIINNVLKKNSTDTDYVPASSHADLKASDVKSAKAIVSADGKYTDYIIYVKDQTDGPNGDSHNGGPVARGVGTLGSIDEALNQLGAEFKSGKENVKLTYTNAYIFARVDNSTGKIINGTYHYLVKINISEAELKLGISAKVKNMYGEVDYFVRIGNNKQGYNGAKG